MSKRLGIITIRLTVALLLITIPATVGCQNNPTYDEAEAAYKHRNFSKAAKLFRQLAEQGNARAQDKIGFMYFYGLGVRRNHQEAMKWYRKAAEQGDARAQFHLGMMYSLLRNHQEAMKWDRKAAEQGDAWAQSSTGFGYYHGLGVPQDYPEAMKWYRKAAEQGEADAQLGLGRMYYYGQGVPRNYLLAHMWANLAAVESFSGVQEEAIRLRSQIESRMTSEQIAEAQRLAKEWKPKN